MPCNQLKMHTKTCGYINAMKNQETIQIDLPINDPDVLEPNQSIQQVLKTFNVQQQLLKQAAFDHQSGKLLLQLDSHSVQTIDINPRDLMQIDFGELNVTGIIITALYNSEVDIISRYFTPWQGVDEDHVTGSAHAVLGSYYVKTNQLPDQKQITAFQASKRTGILYLTVNYQKKRILVSGHAKTFLKGTVVYKV
ncbi:phenazine biosynthesis-like domain-containing protein [Acrasis kona]|uniref:Phenazine biosynthesis-like domain-containing protein n=1 Tax=Acrasis kona TaxID=1008807 RepID=A0AAW2YXE4_9EUKA